MLVMTSHPLTFVVSTHIAFENCLALNSSGGDLCNRQAYDRIHAMTVRLSDTPKLTLRIVERFECLFPFREVFGFVLF